MFRDAESEGRTVTWLMNSPGEGTKNLDNKSARREGFIVTGEIRRAR